MIIVGLLQLSLFCQISRCWEGFCFFLVYFIKNIKLSSSILKYKYFTMWSLPTWTTDANLKIFCPKLKVIPLSINLSWNLHTQMYCLQLLWPTKSILKYTFKVSFIFKSLLVGILLIKIIVALFLPCLLDLGELARVLNSEKICECKNNFSCHAGAQKAG